MKLLAALLSGLLFGAGLAIGDMTNPATVLAFLDVAGEWNPSLAFVMAAAVGVSAAAYWCVWKPAAQRAGTSLDLPRKIDGRLIVGAGLFGVGWGLAGLCPGPALASLVTGSGSIALFVASMVAGMTLFELSSRLPVRSAPASAEAAGNDLYPKESP